MWTLRGWTMDMWTRGSWSLAGIALGLSAEGSRAGGGVLLLFDSEYREVGLFEDWVADRI